jgi:hypothetical protein
MCSVQTCRPDGAAPARAAVASILMPLPSMREADEVCAAAMEPIMTSAGTPDAGQIARNIALGKIRELI